MIALATAWPREVFTALVAGVGAGAAAVGALLAISVRQRRRVIGRARAKVTDADLTKAASELANERANLLRKILSSAIAEVAAGQHLSEDSVGAAIFSVSGAALGIPEGLEVNFTSPASENRIPDDRGVREATEARAPVITVFTTPGEHTTTHDKEERHGHDPALQWLISLPVALPGEYAPWVLAVDGFSEPRTKEDLRSAVGHLLYYVDLLQLLLKEQAK